MKRGPAVRSPEGARFRVRLLVALMLLVALVSAVALFLARRSIAADERRHLEREFQAALHTLAQVREVRHVALLERCRALARKPRIHAALEDDALDLLYLSAADELRDIVASSGGEASPLRARFYRFLDARGRVIPPDADLSAGALSAADEAALGLPHLPVRPQVGYLDTALGLSEVIATPIVSIATLEPIGALVLGFPPVPLDASRLPAGVTSGILYDGRLQLRPALDAATEAEMVRALAAAPTPNAGIASRIGGAPALLFSQQLNAGSLYPAAYEVGVFPLSEMLARQRRLSWQILGAGLGLLLGGFIVSDFVASRFAAPVDRLAHDSEEQRHQRQRAEAELESTHAELQRAARFSADASHQLKTPVTVLRAGLEEMLARTPRTAAECDELSELIHQTYRLSGIIEDLLLLSRIDAGRLRIRFGPVDLSRLIAAGVDDLGALPDDLALTVETDLAPDLHVAGEKRYIALILQNLLENARKYNRPGGRIRLAARREDREVVLEVANTAVRPIDPEAQAHIFERFHRGSVGENIAGYGLGLNLAWELARLHEGDLRLLRSDVALTAFEVRFRALETPVDDDLRP